MRTGTGTRLSIVALGVLVALLGVLPAAGQTSVGYSPWWVATHQASGLWSGPTPEAELFNWLPVGFYLQVRAPQDGPRLLVWNPLTQGEAWVDALAVGPIAPPSEEEIAALTSFEPWWAMTHKPAMAWQTEAPEAEAWGDLPMWRYFRVISPTYQGRVLTLDPRSQATAWLDVDTLGPVGPPPEEYFTRLVAEEQAIGLPGRIVRDTDRYEQPEQVEHFALDRLFQNQPVSVEARLRGLDGAEWLRIGGDDYVPAARVRLPTPPDRTFPGRWVDANLSEPVMLTAYEDDQPVYAALGIKGIVAYQTPTGVYQIRRRVDNETMDSETIGIPRDAKDGYYLKNVLFTQYFTGDGAALHYNYWRSNWGYSGSKGCLGMDYDDALFFWEFATVGTPVYIHE